MRKTTRKTITMIQTKAINIELPNGATLITTVPESLRTESIELLFISMLGTLYGIDLLQEVELQKSFLLKLVGEIVSLAENSVRTIQMANEIDNTADTSEDTSKIIEQFLESLGNKNDKKSTS